MKKTDYTAIARAILVAAERGADFAELGQRLELMLAGKLTPDQAAGAPSLEEQRVRARLVAMLELPDGEAALRDLVSDLFNRSSLSDTQQLELRVAMSLAPARVSGQLVRTMRDLVRHEATRRGAR